MARELKYCSKLYDEPLKETVYCTWKYLKRRVAAFYPAFVIATLIGFILKSIGNGEIFWKDMMHLVYLPCEFLLLQVFGFPRQDGTGVSWYLSALLMACWILYPVVRRGYDFYVRFIAPVVAATGMGILLQLCGTIGVSNCSIEIIRAIADITLGMIIYELSSYVSKKKFSVKGKWMVTFLECFLWMMIVAYMIIWSPKLVHADVVMVIFMSVALILTTCGKSALYGKLDDKRVLYLGKFTGVLYLNHCSWLAGIPNILRIFGLSLSRMQRIALAVVLSILTSWIIIEMIKVFYSLNLKNRILKIVVND